MESSSVTWEIKEHIGILKEGKKGWNREFNLISWNEAAPKFDIRDWSKEHDKCSRGITLHREELLKLVQGAMPFVMEEESLSRESTD